MDTPLINKIVNAVLYEGYILYPYRPSVKNRQRWTFGGIFPESYSNANQGAEPFAQQTQVLIEGSPEAILNVRIRFLHLTDRIIGRIDPPLAEWPQTTEPRFEPTELLEVDNQQYQSWQEATEREIVVPPIKLDDLLRQKKVQDFEFAGTRQLQPLADSTTKIAGTIIRVQQSVRGQIELTMDELSPGLFKLTTRVINCTPLANPQTCNRSTAQMHSMASTHSILNLQTLSQPQKPGMPMRDSDAQDAAPQSQTTDFVSFIDPPDQWKSFTAQCTNIGSFPVLVGSPPLRDTMLCSPIILYDYPQIAPESPGDLFDGGEIDEILTLRILTLSDEEKKAVANVDERARAMLERTHSLDTAQLALMHGSVRHLHPTVDGATP